LLGQVQEICDRVGILANGVLVREGAVHELLAIENQTDVVLQNASPELLREIEALAAKSGARLIEQGPSRTSLERLFLDAIRAPDETIAGDRDE
jgi:ABC-2 type transport system ATP-binding protein